jgi:NTP pyrophosphatase (non-canonical NTP hydrolase)
MRFNVTDLILEAHATATEKGFWDQDRNFGELLMLVVTELGEAMEDYRKGNGPSETWFEPGSDGRDKPCGIPSELADVVIRIADICGAHQIDLQAAIMEKLAYNRTRPYRHGNLKA